MQETEEIRRTSAARQRPSLYLLRGLTCVLILDLLILAAGGVLYRTRTRDKLYATYATLQGEAVPVEDGQAATVLSQGLIDIAEALAPPKEGWPNDPLEALAMYQGHFFLAKEKLNRLTAYVNAHWRALEEWDGAAPYNAIIQDFRNMELALRRAVEAADQPDGILRHIKQAEIWRQEAVQAISALEKHMHRT